MIYSRSFGVAVLFTSEEREVRESTTNLCYLKLGNTVKSQTVVGAVGDMLCVCQGESEG